jgi:hypothetical protein
MICSFCRQTDDNCECLDIAQDNENCLEAGVSMDLSEETEEVIVAKLIEVGRVRQVSVEETDECETCGVYRSGLDDYGNCATCQFFGGLSD